jgi:hypothetical protein
VEEGFTLYPDNAADLHIRGYAGTPLRGISGEVIGILCVLSKNPLRPPPAMQEIMDIIAVKAAAGEKPHFVKAKNSTGSWWKMQTTPSS